MRNILYILVFAILAASVWYYIKFEMPAVKSRKKGNGGTSKEGQKPPSTFPLKKGDQRPEISHLQLYLNIVYDANLVVDGFYGDETEKAANEHLGKTSVDKAEFQQLRSEANKKLPESNYAAKLWEYAMNTNVENYLSFTEEGEITQKRDVWQEAIERGKARSQIRNKIINDSPNKYLEDGIIRRF